MVYMFNNNLENEKREFLLPISLLAYSPKIPKYPDRVFMIIEGIPAAPIINVKNNKIVSIFCEAFILSIKNNVTAMTEIKWNIQAISNDKEANHLFFIEIK